jgi:hypothetical protein
MNIIRYKLCFQDKKYSMFILQWGNTDFMPKLWEFCEYTLTK